MFPASSRLSDEIELAGGTSSSLNDAVETLKQLLELFCSAQPVFIIIDDFQWAGDATARLLEKLVNSDRRIQLGVIIARRPDSRDLKVDSRLAKLSTVPLKPFQKAQCCEYLKSNFGMMEDSHLDALSDVLLEFSCGLPVFVEELAQHFVANPNSTTSYDQILKRKFDQLSQPQFELLSIASSSELPLDRDMLTSLLNCDDLEDSLRVLEKRRLLTRTRNKSAIVPYHAVISTLFRAHAGEEVMKAASQTIVKYLRQRSGKVNEALLGEQLVIVGQNESAAACLVRAAEEMVQQFAFSRAEELYERAISCLPEQSNRSDLNRLKWFERLASICALNGKHDLSGNMFEKLAIETVDPIRKIELQRESILQTQICQQYGAPTKDMDSLASQVDVRLFKNPSVLKISIMVLRCTRKLAPWFRSPFFSYQRSQERVRVIETLAKGFILPNPLLAAYLFALLTFESKRLGESERIRRALDLESILFEAVCPPWPLSLIAASEMLNHKAKMARADEPARRGLVHLANSIRDFTKADMLESIKENGAAIVNYEAAQLESSWEIEILAAFKVFAKHWLGDFNSLNQMLVSRGHHIEINFNVTCRGSSDFSDLANLPGFLMSAVSNSLAEDKPEVAAEYVEHDRKLCQQHQFSGRLHVNSFCKHFLAMYQGRYDSARQNNEYQHYLVKQNGYSLCPVISIQLYLYKAAIYSRLKGSEDDSSAHHDVVLRKLHRKLQRHSHVGFAGGVSKSIEAYFFRLENRKADFDNSISIAVRNFDSVGFFCCSNFLKFQASKTPETDRQYAWLDESIDWAQH